MIEQVFIDLDGVIFDFNKSFSSLLKYASGDEAAARVFIHSHPAFWLGIEKMENLRQKDIDAINALGKDFKVTLMSCRNLGKDYAEVMKNTRYALGNIGISYKVPLLLLPVEKMKAEVIKGLVAPSSAILIDDYDSQLLSAYKRGIGIVAFTPSLSLSSILQKIFP